MQSEAVKGNKMVEESDKVLPLSLAQITAREIESSGREPAERTTSFNEREVWAICHGCCEALQNVLVSDDSNYAISPESIILHADGSITLTKPDGNAGSEFEASKVVTMGTSEKSFLCSLGKTLLHLKFDWSSDSLLHDLLSSLISDDLHKRLTVGDVLQLSNLYLHKSLKGYGTSPKSQDVNGNDGRGTNNSEYGGSTYLRVRSVLTPVLQAALRKKAVTMATEGGGGAPIGPPSLEAFGNLSARAQEILKKIYSTDSLPQSDSKGGNKGGSDSNISYYSNLAKPYASDNVTEGSFLNTNPPAKRNSICSTSESSLQLQSLQEPHSTRRYSLQEFGSKSLSPKVVNRSPSVSPVPIIKISRPDSATPPLVSENRQKMESTVTSQVSNALTKFMKSRQTASGSKTDAKSGDGPDIQCLPERVQRDSLDYSSSHGGTDDENSSGQYTDGDMFMLDDPFPESEAEGDMHSNRIRSHSIANCHIFNSKSSAFRATQSKTVRKQSGFSNLTEIQEEEQKTESNKIPPMKETRSASAYSNIKDLAMLRNKRAGQTHAPRSSDLLSSTTHFTPIVLTTSKGEGSLKSPVMDEAKVKAKKAMELIKLDLKVSRKDKPPPTMLQDLENDAADFSTINKETTIVHNVEKQTEMRDEKDEKQICESTKKDKTPELTTDQKLKLLFEKHGLGSPNPSPRTSPNLSLTLGKVREEESVGKRLSDAKTSLGASIKEEITPTNIDVGGNSRTLAKEKIISPILKPVTVVQHSPLTTSSRFSPIVQSKEETNLSNILSERTVAATSVNTVITKEKPLLDSNRNKILGKSSVTSEDVGTFHKAGSVYESKPKQELTDQVQDIKAAKLTDKRTVSDVSESLKKEDTLQTKSRLERFDSVDVNNKLLTEATVQKKPDVQGSAEAGARVSTEALPAVALTGLNASLDSDVAGHLTMNSTTPIQVELHQDPQTGLYRVVPIAKTSSSTSSSPAQSVTTPSISAMVVSPVQTALEGTGCVGSSMHVSKSISRKKKFVDTSSDPDSSLNLPLNIPQRPQPKSLAERKKDHTKKRAERAKYSVSPHKKAFPKMSSLITDSESSESSFSSPVPVSHEKGPLHARPHRRKPTKSPASSSHGESSDHRKERHRDQLNASRSPQVERRYKEKRSQSKSRDASQASTPTLSGDNRTATKPSYHSQRTIHTRPRVAMRDDTDDTKPIDYTMMLHSPVSVSMSSRDSGVNMRYTTSSGEDLPMMHEAHLADALQSNSHLKKVIKQIRQAFAFDGYLENGVEDLHMAEYISSLASVTFSTFTSAVSEKFCDLYWEEELLENLYEAVNGQKPTKPQSKSNNISEKNSESHMKSKQATTKVNSKGRRSSSDKGSSDAVKKTAPKSHDIRTMDGEGTLKSKERAAQRKPAEGGKYGKGGRKEPRTEGSRERRVSSEQVSSSSHKTGSKSQSEKVSKLKQNSIETAHERDDVEQKRTRHRQGKDIAEGTRSREKQEIRQRKEENDGDNIPKPRQKERESKEKISERRTRKVSSDSKDGRESRANSDGRDLRERRVARGSQEKRDADTSRKTFGSTEKLLNVVKEDTDKPHSSNQIKMDANHKTKQSQETNHQNGARQLEHSILSSSKDDSFVDYSTQDSLTDPLNDSLYMSSTSDLSTSLSLPKQQSTPVSTVRTDTVQARSTPVGNASPKIIVSGARRDSIASFSSTSSGTSCRTQQSFATSSLADSMMESSLEEGHLVMPTGVLYSGGKVDPSVAEYAQNLTGCGETQNSIESKISEVDQQLTLEKRSQKKTAKFYKKLQEKSSAENKALASKVNKELAETNQKIEFLESAKRHLEILYAEQWGLDFSLLYSFATISEEESLVRRENPLLTMHTMRTITTLQAGEPTGLFSYLYARQALLDGYLPHFLYTYHYFATSKQLLDFITSRFTFACKLKMRNVEDDISISIIARTIDILHVWVEGFFDVDFKPHPQFLQELLTFVCEQMVAVEQQSKLLLQLIERRQQDAVNGLTSVAARVQTSDKALPTIAKPLPMPWQVSGSSQSEKSMGFKASLMSCFVRKPNKQDSSAYTPAPHLPREGFHMSDHTSQTIAQALTLIQQALFIQVHPIHFLNSRCYSISVKDTAKSPYSLQLQSAVKTDGEETKSLFAEKVFEGKEIRDLLDQGQVVSHWVSAEVVSSSSAKAQVAILSKFVSVAKTCFDLRNFASCVQVLDGLDNVIVRQVPGWRDLPSKVVSTYEELTSSRVLLQGDSEYLMRGVKTSPTLPATLLFLLHVQQLEIGGFQLTNGMFKWTKLRSIAKLVDQIRIFQESSFTFDLDPSLIPLLKQRMEEFSCQDIHVLAARHSSNYHQLSSDKGRKFANTFQKMKAGLH